MFVNEHYIYLGWNYETCDKILFCEDEDSGRFSYLHQSEVATEGVLLKNVFFKISQNSQENTCARVSFLTKLQTWGSVCSSKSSHQRCYRKTSVSESLFSSTLLKKRLWHRFFLVNFVKFLRTPLDDCFFFF